MCRLARAPAGLELIGIEDDYFISHSASRDREHPSQLAAPEQSEGGPGRNHLGSGSLSPITFSVWEARN